MSSRVKELKKQFEKGASAKKIVDKTLPKTSSSYLYGGKTTEAQETSVPLVVLARPGAYHMVCNDEACYIRVPLDQNNTGAGPDSYQSTSPPEKSYHSTSKKKSF
ncbi:unnamed protein product [Allacma fusca]|uniref:Uncharacterized protein n=1 Tax=Allacma fusca TaxID=39272 RepID=A0A8J2KSD7_9HEXA|nr:unnamed protein product [Allacma fusca]